MKKYTSLFILFVTLTLQALAAPIGPHKALQLAQSFFNKHKNGAKELTMAYTPHVEQNKLSGSLTRGLQGSEIPENLYYVINNGKENGYVVVSGDDRVRTILAYADKGNITEEDIQNHPSIHWLFEEYKSQMQWAIENVPSNNNRLLTRTLPDDERIEVEPLLAYSNDRVTKLEEAISWGQAWPFNLYAPNYKYKGTLYPTVSGCVATAMSTVMRWHKWPNKAKGQVSYYWKGKYMSLNFEGDGKENAPYDWSNMPAAVTGGGYDRETLRMLNDTQADNIGRLLRDVGYAMQMDYNPAVTGGSGAYVYNAPAALRDHFGYKSTVKFLERNNYYTNDWLKNIKSEMETYGPVVYAGFSTGGGHCFVLDGFATGGYVHVDWGWNRSQNGWYALDVLKPGQEGIGGGRGGYSSSQQMLRYLEPDRQVEPKPQPKPQPEPKPQPKPTPIEKKSNLYIYGEKPTYEFIHTEKRATIKITVANNGNDNYVGRLSLAIYKSDEDEHSINISDVSSTLISAGRYRTIEFQINPNNIEEGKYYLAVNYMANNKFTAIQEDAGTLTIKAPAPKPEPKPQPKPKPEPKPQPQPIVVEKPTMLVAFKAFVYAKEKETVKIPITVSNDSKHNYEGTVMLYAIPSGASDTSEKILISSGKTAIKVGQRVNYSFYPNDNFKELRNTSHSENGTKYDLALAFTHEKGTFYASLGYDKKNYKVGELTITSEEKKPEPKPEPRPTPRVERGDIALLTAYFYQNREYRGSDNASTTKLVNNLTVRFYIKSIDGYNGDVNFYITQTRGGHIPVESMMVTKTVKMSAGKTGYVDIPFSTKNLRPGKAYANIQYQVTGKTNFFYRGYDEVSFNVKRGLYYDFIVPGENDEYSKVDLYTKTQGPTFDFYDEPISYGKMQSIGIDVVDQDISEDVITNVEENVAVNKFSVYPKVVKQQVTLTVSTASKVEFFNAAGAQVLTQNLKAGENIIDLSMLVKGVYILKTPFGVEKIVKQ